VAGFAIPFPSISVRKGAIRAVRSVRQSGPPGAVGKARWTLRFARRFRKHGFRAIQGSVLSINPVFLFRFQMP